jgi:hypothetical protein
MFARFDAKSGPLARRFRGGHGYIVAKYCFAAAVKHRNPESEREGVFPLSTGV